MMAIRTPAKIKRLIKAAKDELREQTKKDIEKYLSGYKDKLWYSKAVERTLDTTERINKLFFNTQKKIANNIDVKDFKNLYKNTKIDYDGIKGYKTAEYLDYMYNRVVVDDIKDSLMIYFERFESDLEKILRDESTAAIKDVCKDVMPINFNKPSVVAGNYLRDKKINWANDVMLTTEYSVKNVLTQGFVRGMSIEEIKKILTESAAFSYSRAEKVARTEIIGSCNYADYQGYLANDDIVGKVWLSSLSRRTRATHIAAHGQYRKKDEPFDVGGCQLMYPLDGSLGALAREIVQCRCSSISVFADEVKQYESVKTVYDQADVGTKEWLLRQDNAFQVEYAGGKKKLEYIKDGSLDIKDRNLSLKELKESGKISSTKLASGKKGYTDGYSIIEKVFKVLHSDSKAVEAAFKEFSKQYINDLLENAIVISTADKAYLIRGTSGTVNIGLAGDDALIGAKVIHNHPDSDGRFGDCFSREDFSFFFEKGIEELQVVSNLGRYSMRYDGNKSISAVEAYELYSRAYKEALQEAFENMKPFDYGQLSTMEWISKNVEGFELIKEE